MMQLMSTFEPLKRTSKIFLKKKTKIFQKLINNLMLHGKKDKAEKIINDTLIILKKKTRENPFSLIKNAIKKVSPIVSLNSIRIAGTTYRVPIGINIERQYKIGVKWLIKESRKRSEKSMSEKLAAELIAIKGNHGNTLKKRNELHKLAEKNRMFAHYRW